METNRPENLMFKKSHAKSKIVLENLSLMRDPEDKSLLGKDRDDIVILQVMVLERHGALVEYVAADDYKTALEFPQMNLAPAVSSLRKLSERLKAEVEPQEEARTWAAAALEQATQNFLKINTESGEPEPVAVAVPLEEDEAWQQTLSGRRDT